MDILFEENQEVLDRFEAQGVDLSVARDVEFVHATADKAGADRFAQQAERAGYEVEVNAVDDEGVEDGMLPWDVVCTIHMVPTCQAITEHEKALARMAREHNCEPDGWGFFE